MEAKSRKILWLIALPLALGGAAIFALFGLRNPQPPAQRFRAARAALDQAAAARAPRYAEGAYRQAEHAFRAGWLEMARQKGRLRAFRDYGDADSLLVLAIKQADAAAAQAADSILSVKGVVNREIESLKGRLKSQRETLDGLLKNHQAERQWSLARASLTAGEVNAREGAYEEALETLSQSGTYLDELEALLAQYLSDDEQVLLWRRWVAETLADSRRRDDYAIIVDKSVHTLYLARAGKVLHAYGCELGRNPAYQKRHAGDGATPEGKYRVTQVKKKGSKYYRALLLDYPNQYDKKRFADARAKGLIPRGIGPGAHIEIHGEGGKEIDWTDGCVALTNKDIDAVMKYARVGTPVTIVRRSDQWP